MRRQEKRESQSQKRGSDLESGLSLSFCSDPQYYQTGECNMDQNCKISDPQYTQTFWSQNRDPQTYGERDMTQVNDFDNMDRLTDLTQRLKDLISFETQGPLLSELTPEIKSLSDDFERLISRIESDPQSESEISGLIREIVYNLRRYLRERDDLSVWLTTVKRLRVIVNSLDPQSETDPEKVSDWRDPVRVSQDWRQSISDMISEIDSDLSLGLSFISQEKRVRDRLSQIDLLRQSGHSLESYDYEIKDLEKSLSLYSHDREDLISDSKDLSKDLSEFYETLSQRLDCQDLKIMTDNLSILGNIRDLEILLSHITQDPDSIENYEKVSDLLISLSLTVKDNIDSDLIDLRSRLKTLEDRVNVSEDLIRDGQTLSIVMIDLRDLISFWSCHYPLLRLTERRVCLFISRSLSSLSETLSHSLSHSLSQRPDSLSDFDFSILFDSIIDSLKVLSSDLKSFSEISFENLDRSQDTQDQMSINTDLEDLSLLLGQLRDLTDFSGQTEEREEIDPDYISRLLTDLESGDIMTLTSEDTISGLDHIDMRLETLSDDLSKISDSSLTGLTILRDRLSFVLTCLEDLISEEREGLYCQGPDPITEDLDRLETLKEKVSQLTLKIYEKTSQTVSGSWSDSFEILRILSHDLETVRPSQDLTEERIMRETVSETISGHGLDPQSEDLSESLSLLMTLTRQESQYREIKRVNHVKTDSLLSLVNSVRVSILSDSDLMTLFSGSEDLRDRLSGLMSRLTWVMGQMTQTHDSLESLVNDLSDFDSLLSHLTLTENDRDYRDPDFS